MFRYVTDVSALAQNIIEQYGEQFQCAIDATLGNGYDTDFLSKHYEKVFSFEIQKTAIEKYATKKPSNVVLIHDSHEYLNEYITEEVDCIMYNLGFLPGGDKHTTTCCHSTIESIKKGLNLLKAKGFMTIAVYVGHEEGAKEKEVVLDLVKTLPKNQFGVMLHQYINRSKEAPQLIVIEKKEK